MTKYYNSQRKKNLFDPNSKEAFKISRTKIDMFLKCPRCFYLDRRLGVSQPPGYPFSLNSAVDTLLKKEFDSHRIDGKAHPLMEAYGLNAIPFRHEKIDLWRNTLRGGIDYLHKESGFLVTGSIDDVWQNSDGYLHIVDYKATAKSSEVTLDADWQDGYKRQMEVYQWLFRKNKFKVSDTGYFVYCNGNTDKEAFDARLEFQVKILPYTGDDSWVDGTLMSMKECLLGETPPESSESCDFCLYRKAANQVERLDK